MADALLLSLSDFRALYDAAGEDAHADARVSARLALMSSAIYDHLHWRETTGGDRTIASASYSALLVEEHPARTPRGAILPSLLVTAIGSVKAGTDPEGSLYTLLTAGTDYRLLTDAALPMVRWLAGDPGGDVLVAYTAGAASVPAPLAAACGQLTAWSLALDARRGVQSRSSQSTPSTSYRPEEWPADVLSLLRPWRSPWLAVMG